MGQCADTAVSCCSKKKVWALGVFLAVSCSRKKALPLGVFLGASSVVAVV